MMLAQWRGIVRARCFENLPAIQALKGNSWPIADWRLSEGFYWQADLFWWPKFSYETTFLASFAKHAFSSQIEIHPVDFFMACSIEPALHGESHFTG
jgi:hypothetical protein